MKPLVCSWCDKKSDSIVGWWRVEDGNLCPDCGKEWKHLEVAAYQKLDRVLKEKFNDKRRENEETQMD